MGVSVQQGSRCPAEERESAMFRWLVRGMQHHRSLRLTHKLWASGATLVSGSYVRRAHA